MRKLEINNPRLDTTYRTRLTVDYSSGATLTGENTASYSSNDILVVGEPREELTESKKLNSTTGATTFNLASALNFSHAKGTYLYKTPWDNIFIERRTSSAGVFAEISQSPIQWDNPLGVTVYYDQNATDNYQYRFRFYNSVLAEYSEYSPTLTGAGFSRKQAGYMIRQARIVADDTERKIVTDDELFRILNRGQDIIYTHNPKYWFLLVDTYKQQTGIPAIASTNVYSLSSYSTFGHLESLRYSYTNGGSTDLYHLLKKSAVEFDAVVQNIGQPTDDNAQCYKLLPADADSDNGYFQVYPETKTTGVATFYPNYYEKMADVNSVDDETQVPLPQLLEDFLIGYIHRVRGNEAKARFYEGSLVSDNEKVVPWGLAMLDKMDGAQKQVVGQPRSLWNFRGQRAVTRLFGSVYRNRDYYRENYME